MYCEDCHVADVVDDPFAEDRCPFLRPQSRERQGIMGEGRRDGKRDFLSGATPE